MGDRLQGKIALVTGGSRGIGAAIARGFAEQGARVVIASRKQDALDATAAEINADFPESTFARACHMGKIEQIGGLLDFAVEHAGGIPHILVNNAATNPHFGPMLDIEGWAFDKTFEVNVRGYFEMTRHLVKRCIEAEQPASIINVSSIMGLNAAPLQGVYGMTKAAVISMTRTLAVELAPNHIRVNAIAPGLVDTKFASVLINSPDIVKLFTERTALKRYAQPEELVGAALFLASDDASYVTGQTLNVDGGYTIY